MKIDELYELIINSSNPQNTFDTNLDEWKSFYQNRDLFIIRKNITNEKLYEIIKFLLKNEKGKIFDFFTSNMIDILKYEEEKLIFNLRTNSNYINNPVEALLKNLSLHNELSEYLNQLEIAPDDGITKSSISQYQSNSITRDTLESLIMILHQDFFNMEPKLVHKVIDYIEKQISILEFKITSKNISLLDKNLIYQYLDKFIPISTYIGNDITESTLITKILDGEIKNNEIIKKFISTLNMKQFLKIFNYNLVNFTNFLDSSTSFDEVSKCSLIYKIIDELKKHDKFDIILEAYLDKSSPKYLKICLDENLITHATNKANNESPAFLSIEIIEYLLDTDSYSSNFINNLKELLSSKNLKFKEFEKNHITSKLKNINLNKDKEYSFKECILLINNLLNNNISLTIEQTQKILKIITKQINQSMDLEDIDVYYVSSKSYSGEFFIADITKGINLNNQLIKNLINPRLPLEQRTSIFITILHELRHHQQYQEKIDLTFENYLMKKERFLEKYDPNYYDKNYIAIEEEMDARIESYNMVTKFFEAFFPEHLNALQNSIIESLTKELNFKKEFNKTKTMSVINNDDINLYKAFDTLIKYNPNILEFEPMFNIEYTKEGIPKTIEDLLKERNEENKNIIDEILKIRYTYQVEAKHKTHI